jgi:hypothetical protein
MKSKIYLINEMNYAGIPAFLLYKRLAQKLRWVNPNLNMHLGINFIKNIRLFEFSFVYNYNLIIDMDKFIEEHITPFLIDNNILLFTYSDKESFEFIESLVKKNNNFELIPLYNQVQDLPQVMNFLIRKDALLFAESIKNENTLIAFVFNNLKREIIKFL